MFYSDEIPNNGLPDNGLSVIRYSAAHRVDCLSLIQSSVKQAKTINCGS